ncbi:type IV secretory system conjugative DNA transfer family protein [Sphingomonas sp. SUN039]|uniref:type IV secretory system conjugative DNA transfer family protein n=1 Tax=Sphingomonas sp. SUN039 TaxID=2937787 RepID=UPI002164D677|nr:type IV secretion system DNA-binding domain-containing protein [Sphingomonas sp. SUN039]UVO53058.1 type IV secretion system DNA-binding domain-containing protein [Sphingomonas sp. SUN039]
MDISYFAETNSRNRFTRFGIKQTDRLSHMYMLGKTGVGKSTLIETLARSDLEHGRGFALIDPHGDLAERMRDAASLSRRPFIYLDAAARHQPYGYNPLRRVREDKIPLAVNGLLDAMKKLWGDAWGVRMEHVLRNSLYALIERDGSVLPDVLRLYGDKTFRQGVVRGIRSDVVRRFWLDEFEQLPDRLRAEMVAPIQNKLGALLTDPRLYRALVAPEIPISFRSVMDTGGILIVNLAKGRMGEDSANILGSIMVATIGLAALSRSETFISERRPFFLYVDEFQTFTTLAFANMMPEMRKVGLGLVVAHQYLHQLDDDVRHSVLGNAGTLVSFRVGPGDASVLAREFQPTFDVLDLLNLPNHAFYIKLMIDGTPSRAFSGRTFAPGAI